MERTTDPAARQMLQVAAQRNISTVWDRSAAQEPRCGFGLLGICCRNCLQGPCRIDPYGNGGPQSGTCGASADTIVARNLDRMIAAGTAAHSGHAKHLAHTLMKSALGRAPDYPVRDEAKLRKVAARLGLATEGKAVAELAREVAGLALAEFSEREEPLLFASTTLTPGRVSAFRKHGILPTGVDHSISETLHRTTYGVDADPVNLLLGGLKCSLADYAGMHMATDLSDILFGTPKPMVSQANLGTLKAEAVNVAVHGHNPVLSDIIAQIAHELDDDVRDAGAPAGVNLVGICCTGNEILMRHGIPSATHSVSQELAIFTGVVDAMVVDYQCIMPSLASIVECYHTQLITTMPISKISGATNVEFTEENARTSAQRVIRLAIEAFKKRDPLKVNIPSCTSTAVAGFSSESILSALAAVDPEDPLKPLIDNIAKGNIQGICLFAGCNNVKVTQDANFIEMAKRLARENVLLLATGCGAGTFARHGLLTPEATEEYAGTGLRGVLTSIGQAAGLGGPLPLILHMGSCVDNTRPMDVAVVVANKLGLDLDQLPVVASTPEAATEKAVAIGAWSVAAGLPTHVGVIPPVLGSPLVTKTLTQTARELFGGYFIFETDPRAAADKLLGAIQERRRGMGL